MWQCVAGGDPFCVFLGDALEMRRRPEIQSRIPLRSWMIARVSLPLCWLGSNPRVVCSGDLDLWVPEDSSTVTTRGSFRWRIHPTRGLVFPRFSPRTSPRLKRGPPDFWHDAIGIDNRHVLHNRRWRTQQEDNQEDSDDLPPLLHLATADSCNSPSADCKLPTASPTSASTASPVTDPQSYSPPCISWVSPPCSLRCHRDKHTAAPPESPIQSPIETSVETARVLRSSKRRLLLPTVTGRSTRIQTARNLLWGN